MKNETLLKSAGTLLCGLAGIMLAYQLPGEPEALTVDVFCVTGVFLGASVCGAIADWLVS